MLKKGDYFSTWGKIEVAHHFMQDLQKGERIKTKWAISSSVLPKYKKYPKLRVITGFEYDQFTEESKKAFLRKSIKYLITLTVWVIGLKEKF
ncbi:hypothetical protein AAHB54_10905 [Bacillus cereus]